MSLNLRNALSASVSLWRSAKATSKTRAFGFADLANGEHGRGLNIVPILTGEGINAEKEKKKE